MKKKIGRKGIDWKSVNWGLRSCEIAAMHNVSHSLVSAMRRKHAAFTVRKQTPMLGSGDPTAPKIVRGIWMNADDWRKLDELCDRQKVSRGTWLAEVVRAAEASEENVKTVATGGAGESPTEAAQPSSQD